MSTIKSLGRPQSMSRETRVKMIEYWVNNPDKPMTQIGKLFGINPHTLSSILSRDYLSKKLSGSSGLIIITLPSKINEPELITI